MTCRITGNAIAGGAHHAKLVPRTIERWHRANEVPMRELPTTTDMSENSNTTENPANESADERLLQPPLVLQLECGPWECLSENVTAATLKAGGVEVALLMRGHDGKFGVDWKIDVVETTDERCADFATGELAKEFADGIWSRWVCRILENAKSAGTDAGGKTL